MHKFCAYLDLLPEVKFFKNSHILKMLLVFIKHLKFTILAFTASAEDKINRCFLFGSMVSKVHSPFS